MFRGIHHQCGTFSFKSTLSNTGNVTYPFLIGLDFKYHVTALVGVQ